MRDVDEKFRRRLVLGGEHDSVFNCSRMEYWKYSIPPRGISKKKNLLDESIA